MSKFTPGPWHWHKGYHEEPGDYSKLNTSLEEHGGESIVSSCDGCAIIHNEANARLIAAAPDMYEALIIAESVIKTFIHTDENGVIKAHQQVPCPELEIIQSAIKTAKKGSIIL